MMLRSAECVYLWKFITDIEDVHVELDLTRARLPGSSTVFNEEDQRVYLGANALPGDGITANSRLSPLACLAHELAHAQR